MHDLKFALRQLLKNPGFTGVAVLTLALGIGANTAIFSHVHACLLRPLPFPVSDPLVLVWGTNPQRGWPQVPFSQPNFTDLRAQAAAFDQIGAWGLGGFNLTTGPEPVQVQYATITSNFFSVFGVQPVLGRSFFPEEENPGTSRVVILGHSIWQRQFGGDARIVGQPISLDGNPYEVVGVLPAGFSFATYPKDTDVWIPLGVDPSPGRRFARGNRSLGVVARLKPGVGLEAAQAEMNTIMRRLEQQHPEFNSGLSAKVIRLRDQAVQNVRPALLVLAAAVGLVLLIACANVANLLLARSRGRQREMAIRTALGAKRSHLIRQLFVENLLLALAGGTLGLVFAAWGMQLLVRMPYGTPEFFVPYNIQRHAAELNLPVLLFTFGLSILTGVAFGTMPALRALRLPLARTLQEGGGRASPGRQRHRTGRMLVGAELALSTVLLVGAGLLMKSFLELQKVDAGFRPEHLLAFELNLPKARYAQESKLRQFHEDLHLRLSALPEVQSAGAVEFPPLSGRDGSTQFFIEGQPMPAPHEKVHAHWRSATPEYFRTMGIKLVAGREFTEEDHAKTVRVAVINETMARRFFPAGSALGQRVALDFEAMRFFPDRPPEFDLASGLREIVGVISDVKHSALDAAAQPEIYVPFAQRAVHGMTVMLRASGDPQRLVPAVREIVRELDPAQPLASITTMAGLLDTALARPKFNAVLMTVFGVLAVALAVIGVYGVMSFIVTERTREIGIHMAMGAQPRDVVMKFVREGGRLAGAGILAGLIASMILAWAIRGLLFNTGPLDGGVFAAMALGLGSIAMLACYLPARRATRIDPIATLRQE